MDLSAYALHAEETEVRVETVIDDKDDGEDGVDPEVTAG